MCINLSVPRGPYRHGTDARWEILIRHSGSRRFLTPLAGLPLHAGLHRTAFVCPSSTLLLVSLKRQCCKLSHAPLSEDLGGAATACMVASAVLRSSTEWQIEASAMSTVPSCVVRQASVDLRVQTRYRLLSNPKGVKAVATGRK